MQSALNNTCNDSTLSIVLLLLLLLRADSVNVTQDLCDTNSILQYRIKYHLRLEKRSLNRP